jgi:hypothetical protein
VRHAEIGPAELMGRSQANLQFGVFEGLRGLSPLGKLVYFRLLVEDTLNQAGVCALRVQLWADDLELTVEETEKALQELDEQRYAFVDHGYQQVLVRTLIRNDGVAAKPNVLWSAVRAAKVLRSPRLRRELATELRKLPPKPPDKTNADGKVTYVYADPHQTADEIDPGPPTGGGEQLPIRSENPSEKGSGNPSGTVPEPIPAENPSRTLPGTTGGGGGGGGVVTPPPESSTGVSSVARTHAHAYAREPEPDPQPDDEPEPDPAVAGGMAIARESRRRARRDRSASLLSAQARTLGAHNLVERWASTLPANRRPVRKVLTALGTEVDEHLRGGWSEADLEAVLAFWATKSVGPGVFGSIASEWANRQARPSQARSTVQLGALDALRDPDPIDALPPRRLRAIEGA